MSETNAAAEAMMSDLDEQCAADIREMRRLNMATVLLAALVPSIPRFIPQASAPYAGPAPRPLELNEGDMGVAVKLSVRMADLLLEELDHGQSH